MPVRVNLSRDELEQLIKNIYLSIEGELRDAAYYRALAAEAPDQFSEEMIMEFSQDDREHAYQLQRAYEILTGRPYTLPFELEFEFDLGKFSTELENSILGETSDYKKYKELYLMTRNPELRDIFFNAMHDDAYHAIRQLYLLNVVSNTAMSVKMKKIMNNNNFNRKENSQMIKPMNFF